MRSTTQEETREWISRLEELAVQSGLKMRLLDAIRDCKRDLEPEWRQKCVEIGELLEQVKKQLCPQEEQSSLKTEVAERASEILTRCRRMDELLQDNILQQAVQESYRQIGDYMRIQHEHLFSELVPDLFQEQDKNDGKKTVFAALCTEWENIRQKGES